MARGLGWGLLAAGAAVLVAGHSFAQQDTEAPLADLDARKGVAPPLSIASSLPYNGDPFGTRAWTDPPLTVRPFGSSTSRNGLNLSPPSVNSSQT